MQSLDIPYLGWPWTNATKITRTAAFATNGHNLTWFHNPCQILAFSKRIKWRYILDLLLWFLYLAVSYKSSYSTEPYMLNGTLNPSTVFATRYFPSRLFGLYAASSWTMLLLQALTTNGSMHLRLIRIILISTIHLSNDIGSISYLFTSEVSFVLCWRLWRIFTIRLKEKIRL